MDKNSTHYKIKNLENSFLSWTMCISASLFFFYEFILGNMFASIADDIMMDFNIKADKMAYISSIHYVSNVLFLFFAGFLLDRFSAKRMMFIAMLFCIISTFILSQTYSFKAALICRFITGVGSAFCFLGPVRIASNWFSSSKMALVTGVIVTIAMAGGVAAQYPLTKISAYAGWRNSMMIIAWIGILMLMFMIFWIKDSPYNGCQDTKKKQVKKNIIKEIYFNKQVLQSALYTSLMNMAIAIFGAMMGSLYIMQRINVSKETAAMINSLLFLGAIVGGPFIGWISDKCKKRIMPMQISAIISCFIILAILYLPMSTKIISILFFLLGFFTASQVISYALVSEGAKIKTRGRSISVISIFTQGGYVLYQNLFSKLLLMRGEVQIKDYLPIYSEGDYQRAAIIIPIGLIIAFCMTLNLKETHCQKKVHSGN